MEKELSINEAMKLHYALQEQLTNMAISLYQVGYLLTQINEKELYRQIGKERGKTFNSLKDYIIQTKIDKYAWDGLRVYQVFKDSIYIDPNHEESKLFPEPKLRLIASVAVKVSEKERMKIIDASKNLMDMDEIDRLLDAYRDKHHLDKQDGRIVLTGSKKQIEHIMEMLDALVSTDAGTNYVEVIEHVLVDYMQSLSAETDISQIKDAEYKQIPDTPEDKKSVDIDIKDIKSWF